MQAIDETPKTVKQSGKLIYSVEALLAASPETVWQKITTPEELLRWDSMLMEFEGEIKEGGKIKLRSKMSPKQVFKLNIPEFVPNLKMVWSSSMGPLFKGVRTYQLQPKDGGTYFSMKEEFSGWLLPIMKKALPDCDVLFGTYIKDLKNELI